MGNANYASRPRLDSSNMEMASPSRSDELKTVLLHIWTHESSCLFDPRKPGCGFGSEPSNIRLPNEPRILTELIVGYARQVKIEASTNATKYWCWPHFAS